MKTSRSRTTAVAAVVLLAGALLLGGCVNFVSTDSPATLPGGATPSAGAKVVYSYGDTGPVQLSANNIVLKVGEKLVLQPAAGLTGNTRFSSAGQYFFYDIVKKVEQPDSTKLVFEAVKPGKGKLQIIPSGDQTDRATDLWVTVE